MARLRRVPDWVGPSLRAVAAAEDFTLRLFDKTRAPRVLGSWVSLAWLGAEQGDETAGPFGQKRFPTEEAAWAAMLVADSIAEAEPYPAPSWWAARGIAREARLAREDWETRSGSGYERHYAHGVTVALGWVTGERPDPRLMAPMLDGNADPIPVADRDQYRAELWNLSQPERPIIAS